MRNVFSFLKHKTISEKTENYFKSPTFTSDVPDGIKIVATDNRE